MGQGATATQSGAPGARESSRHQAAAARQPPPAIQAHTAPPIHKQPSLPAGAQSKPAIQRARFRSDWQLRRGHSSRAAATCSHAPSWEGQRAMSSAPTAARRLQGIYQRTPRRWAFRPPPPLGHPPWRPAGRLIGASTRPRTAGRRWDQRQAAPLAFSTWGPLLGPSTGQAAHLPQRSLGQARPELCKALGLTSRCRASQTSPAPPAAVSATGHTGTSAHGRLPSASPTWALLPNCWLTGGHVAANAKPVRPPSKSSQPRHQQGPPSSWPLALHTAIGAGCTRGGQTLAGRAASISRSAAHAISTGRA